MSQFVRFLRQTTTIRAAAQYLLARCHHDGLPHFRVDKALLPALAQRVANSTLARCPTLKVPPHSRWRHFEAQGVPRWAQVNRVVLGIAPDVMGHPDVSRLRFDAAHPQATQITEARIDLVVVSVLLDAGAGPDWRYFEACTGQVHTRSEGLGVASLHAFNAGLFSSDPAQPGRVDAAGLAALTPERLAEALQVAPDNPLVGLQGRVTLLQRLGATMAAQPEVFGALGRPGGLFAHVQRHHAQKYQRQPLPAFTETRPPHVADVFEALHWHANPPPALTAHEVLTAVLEHLSDVWPTPSRADGLALGDCWRHSALANRPGHGAEGWMPFHKLSQWLTYSLLEPLAWAGVAIEGQDELTGLPEYRNGGLLIDFGVLSPRNPEALGHTWAVGDEFIVEWRALTVALLDELAPMVRERLGRTAQQMPLACVLEGGTWSAGRELAHVLRGGAPPLRIALDGTVF